MEKEQQQIQYNNLKEKKDPEQELPQELQHSFNQPPRELESLKQSQGPIQASHETHQYKYLTPSDKTTRGTFSKRTEFDIRFDELKNTMITKGLISVITTFYPEVRKYSKEHPDQIRTPSNRHKEILERELKMVKPDFQTTTEKDIRYTWIGHSTAVIQVGPDNLMIDPVFSDRASPSQMVGPKRFRPPACSIPELPPIHAVFISHDHYDHLDQDSLKKLHTNFEPLFVAGIGSEGVLPKKSNCLLMDWMDVTTVGINGRQYKVTFVPVCHWSKRGVKDLNTRLWGGFVIQTPFNQKIFYSGDTGYCPVFKQIGQMFGPFDLTILPIGAYQPRNILRPQHINPEQAVIVHRQLNSRQSVGVHWGTFPLGTQGFYQAKIDLAQARKKHNMPDDQFITINHGESVVFNKDKPFKN